MVLPHCWCLKARFHSEAQAGVQKICFSVGFPQSQNVLRPGLVALSLGAGSNTVTEHLQSRYTRDQIYTYVGDILIAVNPFHDMEIYSPQRTRWEQHRCHIRLQIL
uniref:Myosin motor domain-containing protein n=1 Tax=Xiphophorus couchianus TaxID=32473 RepID=A0A3B5M7C9_9TELE